MVKVNPVILELNPVEAQELAQMIDIAVKAVGIRAAKSGLNMHEKLIQAAKSAGYQVQGDGMQPEPPPPQSNGKQTARGLGDRGV